VSLHFEIEDEKVLAELSRLADGPDPARWEGIMSGTFAAVSARVHIITGLLRGSGAMATSYDGEVWTGTISFVRYPGIFELARGNTPTANHPAGGHHFYEPAYASPQAYKDSVLEWLAEGG
jgi:hypothetical protein